MGRVAVVGAGIAGLAAAHALRDHDVVVVEGASRIGG
jgi:protoporphyrinogen oxidase